MICFFSAKEAAFYMLENSKNRFLKRSDCTLNIYPEGYLERHQYKLFAQRVKALVPCAPIAVIILSYSFAMKLLYRIEVNCFVYLFLFYFIFGFCCCSYKSQFYLIRLFFGPILCSVFISTLKSMCSK
jgi:hypothetical protein